MDLLWYCCFVLTAVADVLACNNNPENCPELSDGKDRPPKIVELLESMIKNQTMIESNNYYGLSQPVPNCTLDHSTFITKFVIRSVANCLFLISRTIFLFFLMPPASNKVSPGDKIVRPEQLPPKGPDRINALVPYQTLREKIRQGTDFLYYTVKKPDVYRSYLRLPIMGSKGTYQIMQSVTPYKQVTLRWVQSTIRPDVKIWLEKTVVEIFPKGPIARSISGRSPVVAVMLGIGLVFNIAGRILHATASSLPRHTGTAKCFENTLQYIEAAYQTMIQQSAIDTLTGFRNLMEEHVENAKTYCNICDADTEDQKDCHVSCSSQFIQRLAGLYDEIERKRYIVLEPVSTEIWSIHFLREYCSIQFLVGSQIVAFSNETDPETHKIYLGKMFEKTQQCVNETQFFIDKSVQNLRGDDLKRAPALRAIVCESLVPYFMGFEVFTNFTNCSGGVAGKLRGGDIFMIRNTFQNDSNHWFNCGSNSDVCNWTSCAGIGAAFNAIKREKGDVWDKCQQETFQMYEVNSARRTPINAGDEISLFNDKGSEIFWGYEERVFAKVDGSNECKAIYLRFRPDNYKENMRRGVFIIEAYDWSGRIRNKGEEVQDRDWIALKYAERPDAKWLSNEPGLFYIEGFLFIAPRNNNNE